MKFYKVCSLILACLSLFSGCAASEQAYANKDTIPETTTYIDTTPVETESVLTEAPSEPPTEPDLSLKVEPGSYLLRYDDKNTGDYLDYYVFIPNNPQINMPLVVFLHGDGEVGKPEALEDFSMIAQARTLYGDDFPFIAISPCTRVKSWKTGSIPQTLKGLMDAVVSEYVIDSERIIITGHSRGSAGVWNMISTYGDYFCAAVPVSSPEVGYINIENCAKVPVRAFAGTVGEFELACHGPMQNIVKEINQISEGSTFTVLKGCDHSETKDYAFSEETFEWMLAQ